MAAKKFTRITGAMQATALEGTEPDRLFGGSRQGMRFVEPRLELIDLNPGQPRRHFDPDALRALAESIEQHGQKQPIGVQQQDNGRWLLVFGERRLRACQILGRTTIQAVVTDGDPLEIALIENLQRENLTLFETADAYERLMVQRGYNRSTLARVVGTTPTTITRLLAVRTLPPALRHDVESGAVDVSKSMLMELAEIGDPKRLHAVWAAVKDGATVREVRALKQDPAPSGAAPAAPDEPLGATDGQGPDSPAPVRTGTPTDPFERSVRRLETLVRPFRDGRTPLDGPHRERLLGLRRLLDELLEG